MITIRGVTIYCVTTRHSMLAIIETLSSTKRIALLCSATERLYRLSRDIIKIECYYP
jgi:hypothetical protein